MTPSETNPHEVRYDATPVLFSMPTPVRCAGCQRARSRDFGATATAAFTRGWSSEPSRNSPHSATGEVQHRTQIGGALGQLHATRTRTTTRTTV